MTAIAAVDTALWDIKGKVAGLPVYQLLGGRSPRRRAGLLPRQRHRRRRRCSTTSPGSATSATRRSGPRPRCPDIGGTYGVRKGTVYEPAAASLPGRAAWSTEAYLDFAPGYLARVRERFGFDFHLLHDVHHRLTPIEAARFGKEVEHCRLFWMEDPTPAENQEAFRLIRQHTTTPIAVGEVLSSIWDVQQLITEQLIDYVRTTVVHAGGITHLRRIFDLAALYQVRTGSHGATDLSPVTLAAAVHLDLAVPNFGIQEYMAHADGDAGGLPHPRPPRGRMLTPPRCRAWASSTTRRPPSGSRTSPATCPSPGASTAPIHDW